MSFALDFESLQDDGRSHHHISAIKLKAMAMRMRHRVRGYAFTSTPQAAQQQQQQLLLPSSQSSRSDRSPADRAPGTDLIRSPHAEPLLPSLRDVSPKSYDTIEGPNNLLGLKTIFIHPFCIPLVCVPLGIMSKFLEWGPAWTFWLNFLALVPLAKILGDATEELAFSIRNDTVTGLLNATFGNAVEMIVAVQSLRKGLYDVVKTSLLGSVLSNILLVLGTAFLLGGLTTSKLQRGRFHSFNDSTFRDHGFGWEKEQKFPVKGALINMAMLLFSCMSFALPTIFNSFPSDDSKSVLKVSRFGALIVTSAYIAFLVFQLLTHTKTLTKEEASLANSTPVIYEQDPDDDEEESASLTVWCSFVLMALCTVVVSINSEFLVGAIESVVRSCGIPESFIGVVLLPIAGNACEHAAAIRFAVQDRPGLAIGIAVGSSTQVALLVVPFSVLVGWAMDKPMNLDFGALHTVVVTLSILVVLTLLLDGRSNWLKGYILVCLYVFIAVLYWFAPLRQTAGVLPEL